MKVGIEKIGFYTSPYYVSMNSLAVARDVDPGKFLYGLGQREQSVIPPTQDTVTMAANAADKILTTADKQQIAMIIVGTETGVDNSKAAALYVQSLLGISNSARAFEIKQACYGATAGIQMARDYVTLNPEKKVLVIGSDIARYGLKTAGEPTQGGGAVAMLISSDPQILELNNDSVFYSQDVMDFWRPLERKEALVDGHYSTDVYTEFFDSLVNKYHQVNNTSFADFAAFLFHIPFTKMGLKALRSVVDIEEYPTLFENFEASKLYNSQVGNLYTGSLYLSLISLIANAKSLTDGDLIGFYSYGSGAQGEFFTGNFKGAQAAAKIKEQVDSLLADRIELSVLEYEIIYQQAFNKQPDYELDITNDNSKYILTGRKNYQFQYLNQAK